MAITSPERELTITKWARPRGSRLLADGRQLTNRLSPERNGLEHFVESALIYTPVSLPAHVKFSHRSTALPETGSSHRAWIG